MSLKSIIQLLLIITIISLILITYKLYFSTDLTNVKIDKSLNSENNNLET